jgi:hypothetical protein
MWVSVQIASTNRVQVFETRERTFCLRSKRSEVRILSGVPIFKDLQALPLQKCALQTFCSGGFLST